MRKVLVTGSREYLDSEAMEKAFDEHIPEEKVLLIHGQCRGADMTADKIARARNWWVATCPADWTQGKRAGMRRNEKMLRMFEPDLVIAFPSVDSVGTYHMIMLAEKAGIHCVVIT
jgi:hypothetical protein